MIQPTPIRKVVLCVDDEEIVLSLLESALPMLGYVVVRANNGTEALNLAATRPFDAVILDYNLPGADGGKVATELKRVRPNTPIIMFSGSQDIPSSALAQVDVLVPKGEGLVTLLAVLQRVLRMPTGEPVAFRKVRRFPVELSFTVIVNRSGRMAMLRGMSVNLGEGGIGGRIEGDLIPGELVVLAIVDARLERQLEPRAQVRYHIEDTCGFEFLDVSPPEQADMRQLCERLASA